MLSVIIFIISSQFVDLVAAGWYWNEGEAAKIGIIVATVVCSVLIVGCMGAMVYCCMIKPMKLRRWERYLYGDPRGVKIIRVPRGPPDIIDRTLQKTVYVNDQRKPSKFKAEHFESSQRCVIRDREKKALAAAEFGRDREFQERKEAAQQLVKLEEGGVLETEEKEAEQMNAIIAAPPPYESHTVQTLAKPPGAVVTRESSAAQTTASAIRDARRRERTRDAGVMAQLPKKQKQSSRKDRERCCHEKRSASVCAQTDEKKKQSKSSRKRTVSSDRTKLIYSTTKGTQTAAFPR